MIYVNSNLSNKKAEIEKAIKYIEKYGENAKDGIVELDGENLYISFQSYTTQERENCKYESHKKYIDLQYIIDGEEIIAVTTPGLVSVSTPYSEEKDVMFYDDLVDGQEFYLTKGQYIILDPLDVHMPKIKMNEACKVKKAVAKIKI